MHSLADVRPMGLNEIGIPEEDGVFLFQVPVVSIVDDDASVREATKRLLRSVGYVALTFSSAEEFLNSGRLRDTSCLIADVRMPGLSGIELQSHLTATGCRVPMIFITAFVEESMRAQALEAGAFGFLSKPCNAEVLTRCLEEALRSTAKAAPHGAI